GTEHAKDGRLFDDLAVVTAVKSIEKVADDARLIDHLAYIFAGALLAGGKAQHSLFDAGHDQKVFQRAFVFQILLRFSPCNFVKRRLSNENVAALDQLFHLPEEQRQQESTDVRALDIPLRHDDDLVIAQFVGIEFIASDAGAERRDQRADFLARQHLVETRPFHVENLAAQRQHRLEFAVAPLLGGAAGAVALNDKKL